MYFFLPLSPPPLTGLPIGRTQIDLVFKKVAGPDQKLSKAEFTQLMGHLIKTHGAAPAHH
jgi:hypothetical protein